MKKVYLLGILSLFLITTAQAKSAKYGVAGCGLGSMVFKNDNGVAPQVLAATTNGTFYSQTFGITSGTSNCTDDGTVAARKQLPMFIETNQIALANDIVRGNGETLSHLSKVMGCKDTEILSSSLKNNYGTIFTTENIKSDKITSEIINTIRHDSRLASSCSYMI